MTATVLLPPTGYNFFLFSRRVQVDNFNHAREYAIVAYDATTKKRVRSMPIVKRDGSIIYYRDSGNNLVALDTRGGDWPSDSKTGLRLHEPQFI